ncbi:hypothetical protein N7495_001946 [Penicillium taxi]|uniref:uncharacterized protein n=1 Tax=Penicillium taxi TaxID=168475 RepID=UPI0025458345|nr:uncharacterized protein N7495_001946 [Penicillium taxi]KAJ5909264.1 hypothetical protein N7495_001946 [Penicillium taxi]
MDMLSTPKELRDSNTNIQGAGFQNSCPETLIDLAIESNIERIEKAFVEPDNPFFVADLGQVARLHRTWKQLFPEVHPYYAVKCNPDPTLLKCLADLGTGFDCASVEEMRTVFSLGVHPSRILFANPCKSATAMNFAHQAGVMLTTFDNLDELERIKVHLPDAALLLRIYAHDDGALICLSEKFGAHLDMAKSLVSRAWDLQLNIVGVSFHVGTGASDPQAFCQAVEHARHVFSLAKRQGFQPTILDIGGGFQDNSLISMASVIRASIKIEFDSQVTVIAEPGRYYARSAYTLISQVIARRCQIGTSAATGVPDMLYQNDGVYGNFMNVIMEKEVMIPRLLRRKLSENGSIARAMHKSEKRKTNGTVSVAANYRYSIWGPTCDSTDCVVRDMKFEAEVRAGDWLIYNNMGAYTLATTTQFNGFGRNCPIIYVNSERVPEH